MSYPTTFIYRQTDSAIYEAIPSSTAHHTVKGNGVVNGSPAGPLASSTDPPPYSLLAMASPPPSAAVRGPSQPVAISSSLMSDLIDNQNYGKFESDVYTVPFSPMKEITAGRGKEQFQLSRNESYGSLPTTPLPHYATPTSTLRYIPEMEANAQPQANSDDYEPMILLPGAMTSSDGTPLS